MKHLIQIIPATLEHYPIIQNMARFYVYDLSRTCGYISQNWAIPSNGLYESSDFKIYLEDPTRKAFLVKVAKELAGFVLLNQAGTNSTIHWNVGEFFVLAKFQRQGIGQQLAHQIWNIYPGIWEVAVLPKNKPAIAFWRQTIDVYVSGKYSSEIKMVDYDQYQPERLIFTFVSPPKSNC
jgi:predicted acetyltransferase